MEHFHCSGQNIEVTEHVDLYRQHAPIQVVPIEPAFKQPLMTLNSKTIVYNKINHETAICKYQTIVFNKRTPKHVTTCFNLTFMTITEAEFIDIFNLKPTYKTTLTQITF